MIKSINQSILFIGVIKIIDNLKGRVNNIGVNRIAENVFN
jgi:hypothetical protein